MEASVCEVLKECDLFFNLDLLQIEDILNQINYTIETYMREDVIALEGDDCSSLSIVLDGISESRKIHASGKTVILTQFRTGSIFGDPIVFSTYNQYPASLFALEKTKLMVISREEILKLCNTNRLIMENFLKSLSDKVLILNKKIVELSLETIRQKICNFLLEQYKIQKSLSIKLPFSKKKMADSMGVQRPSLSRELMKMRDEEIIDFSKDLIQINDLQKIKDVFL